MCKRTWTCFDIKLSFLTILLLKDNYRRGVPVSFSDKHFKVKLISSRNKMYQNIFLNVDLVLVLKKQKKKKSSNSIPLNKKVKR